MNKIKPKFILSKSKVLEQYQKLVPFADQISYSSKTNPLVTKILEKETKCFFSIHFVNELKHVQDKSRIVFLAQAWDEEEIKSLLDQQIHHFIVDNESDLDILLNYLSSNEIKQKVTLFLRIKLKENTLRTEKYFVFGMSSKIINSKIEQISMNKNIKNKIAQLGVHFHRKTQNMSEWNLQYEIEQMLSSLSLRNLNLINIGGGLPSVYANTNAKVLPGIFNKITELKQWLNDQEIKLVIEPGRFIAAPAGKLVTRIVGIHQQNIVVNASVYNSDMDALIVPVKLLVEGEFSQAEEKENETILPFVVKGITPCSMDLFRYRVYLKNPQIGQELVFLNAGAYGFSTNFCDLDTLEMELIE